MKQWLTWLFLLACLSTMQAECAWNGLYVFPSNQQIKQNSIFVLEGYGISQEIIQELNHKYPIYLTDGEKKVKLIVTERCVGQLSLTQALLKPEGLLEAGVTYTLQIEGLESYERISKFKQYNAHKEPITYTVVEGQDTEKPSLTAHPKEIDKIFEVYGCGPESWVVFTNPAKDDSELLARTTVKNKKTGKEVTYYIPVEEESINVGHGMCSGGFVFNKGTDFEVDFIFVDSSGNRTERMEDRLTFTKPQHQFIDGW